MGFGPKPNLIFGLMNHDIDNHVPILNVECHYNLDTHLSFFTN